MRQRRETWVALGRIEQPRDRGHSVYCSLVLIDDAGDIHNVRRKLMPNHEQRLVWATGDSAGLQTFDVGDFRLGRLNGWENWMPLARSALQAQREDLRLAIWPGNVRNTADMTCYMAREGRSYVLSVSGLPRRDDIPAHIPEAELMREALPIVPADGGSCIAGPDGRWLIPPHANEETLLVAGLSHVRVREARQSFDPSGHYSRPDVLSLKIDRRRQSPLAD